MDRYLVIFPSRNTRYVTICSNQRSVYSLTLDRGVVSVLGAQSLLRGVRYVGTVRRQ